MSTQVQHGPAPRWTVPVLPGRYRLTVEGAYTRVDGLAAAGVTRARFKSTRPVKRRGELLALRTAFVCWWLAAWAAEGGPWATGVGAFAGYPWRRLRRQLRARQPGLDPAPALAPSKKRSPNGARRGIPVERRRRPWHGTRRRKRTR